VTELPDSVPGMIPNNEIALLSTGTPVAVVVVYYISRNRRLE